MTYHGVDLHKSYATISVRDESGKAIRFLAHEANFGRYIEGLGSTDVVVLEASTGTFRWATRIQEKGARCLVLDAYRFRIIRDSWNKSDRRDAVNLSLALWLGEQSGEVKLPLVWQPTAVVRDLRKLFGQYQLLNKQIRQLKAQVESLLVEEGIGERAIGQAVVEHPEAAEETLAKLELSDSSRTCIRMSLRLLTPLQNEKQRLRAEIVLTGEPLQESVKLLMTIRGVTAFLALAFLADVGDISRFSSLRKLYAYLGVVPGSRSSGGKTRDGHINRQSRELVRTLFSQAVPHLVASSPTLGRFYQDLVARRGYGRARIAILRKVIGMMRRMLLSGTPYRGFEPALYEKKLRAYRRELRKAEKQREVA